MTDEGMHIDVGQLEQRSQPDPHWQPLQDQATFKVPYNDHTTTGLQQFGHFITLLLRQYDDM